MRTKASVLVGRTVELETALIGLEQSVHAGDGPAYFCVGEAGVGKSRLVAEVASLAFETGLVVMRGRASCMAPVSPLRPFAEALAGIQRQGLLPTEQLGGYRPLLARVLPQLSGAEHLGIGGGVPIMAFAEAVLRVLMLIGNDRGCLLVLEDLHDFDSESLAVLDYLLDNLAGTPVAVLGALRDEPGGTRDLLAAAERRGTAELLAIRPLDQEHTGVLVAACLGTDRPPREVAELVWRNSAGNPLVIEELLYDMLDSNQLSKDGNEWRLATNPVLSPPSSMLRLVGTRIDRLGELAGRMLINAAVYGERFPLASVLAATGDSELDLLYAIQAASAGQLLSIADLPGWYQFRHPLIHSAVLELAGPVQRRQAAAALATATLSQDPELTGETCRTAARLLAESGQPTTAGELYARAGRRALHRGAIEWAVADLSEAIRLLSAAGRLPPDLIGELVIALGHAGQLDRALELVDRLTPVTDDRDRQRRALTHVDLAWGCYGIGQTEQAYRQLAIARSLVTEADTDLVPIHCDVIEACLDVDQPRSSSDASAQLALAAAERAERSGAAEAACRAWHAHGRLARESNLEEATRSFQHIITLADRHRLPNWELHGMVGVAGNRWLAECDHLALQAAHDRAQRAGAVSAMLSVQANIWVHQVLTGADDLGPAVIGLADCVEQARRLGYIAMVLYSLAALAIAAAHRADRAGLADALARFDAAGGGHTTHIALTSGLGMAFCLALEGRDAEALATLQDLSRRQPASPYCLSGRHGLAVLLAATTGVGEPAATAAMLDSCNGQMRWNRQFLHWAAAVHAGRQGERTGAAWHAAQAARDAEVFPAARHLAIRLVAPAAAADGWGAPVPQLRAAEAWFHEQGVAAAARSCRDLLRSIGAPVRQRRDGSTEIPVPLRTVGVTTREYQVGLLVQQHLGNRAIGDRLHISPRTVEKHVAALLTKLSAPDRSTLIDRLAAHH
ncbi:MAG TPA: AAA family ATPase [Jatrophihabitans sp.]|nr:AAA family ATPase [Jatrophihabitans sp.]